MSRKKFTLRMPKSLHDRLVAAAASAGASSLSDFIVEQLKNEVQKENASA